MELHEIKVGRRVLYHPVITVSGRKIGTRETTITSEAWQLGHGDG